MATVYKLIGKGTTQNGVATMTQKTSDGGSTWTDVDGLTGEGKGLRKILASTDSTITSSSLQSETYSILDCLKYDGGVTGNSNLTIWSTSGGTPSVTSEYTKLEYTNEVITHQCNFTGTDDFKIEFDVWLSTSNRNNYDITIRDSSAGLLNYLLLSEFNFAVETWHHVIMTVHDNSCTISNTTNSYTRTRDITGYSNFRFDCRSGEELRYRNFKIYPI